MKKVFLFLSAVSFVAVSSCSSDDDSPGASTPTGDVLVKRVAFIEDDGFNATIDYTYNGNKLVQGLYHDGTIEKYYYEGDLITKVEYIEDNAIFGRFLFEYDMAGKLIDYKDQAFEDGTWETWDHRTYVHNSDNTITDNSGMTLTMQNGEISQAVSGDGTIYTYTYDGKNSPFKNVTGYAEIANAFAGDHEFHGRSQNIVSIIDETHSQNYTLNNIQYNANNYPTSITSVAIFDSNFPGDSETLTVAYSY